MARKKQADPAPLPDPAVRARPGASGTPVVLADGREWLLGDGGLGNHLDALRDAWFDATTLRGSVPYELVYAVAFGLLELNYRPLSRDEFLALVAGVDPQAIADAARSAMFGDRGEDVPDGYTAWATSQLLANAIDPATVPTPLLGHVLATLVRLERAVPVDEFVESMRKAAGFAALRSLAGKAP